MSRNTRTEATLLNDLKTFILTVKQDTTTIKPEFYAITGLVDKYRFHHSIVPALAEKGLIRVIGEPNKRKQVQWAYGSGEITDDFVVEIRNLYNKLQSDYGRKTPRVPKVKVEATQSKSEVKSVAKTRGPYKVKPKPIVVVKAKVDAPKAAYSPLSPFKDIRGTIFGYKQLRFMKQTFLHNEISVIIDDRYVIPSVQLISYEVEGSELRITFFMYAHKNKADDTSSVGVIKLTNMVLAFTEKQEEGKTILHIQTIPVSDPYEIKV